MKGIKLGEMNTMKVVKAVDFGMYLDGGDEGEILLPTRYVPDGCKPGDTLYFVHHARRNIKFSTTNLFQSSPKFRLKYHRQCDNQNGHQFVQNPANHMELQPSSKHRKYTKENQTLQKSRRSGITNQYIYAI